MGTSRSLLNIARDAGGATRPNPDSADNAVTKDAAKAPSASAVASGLSRSTVEERQARQLAAMQAHVDAITAARRERSHVSRLRNYWV